MYDLCVVGAGMIGSSAARHATVTSGLSTCLIGPSEPKGKRSAQNVAIYGSYFDEGRITRCLDKDFVWSTLAQESIKRYRDIERQSGIKFYYEVGNLMVGGKTYLSKTDDVASRNAIPTEFFDNKSLQHRFPYLRFTNNTLGSFETQNAGHINPRRIVQAQKVIAAEQGCTIIDDVVNHVTRIVQSDGTYAMQVKTEEGRTILCKRVLLATGAFTTFKNLMPYMKPEQKLSPISVSLLEVDKSSLETLSDMPCVIYYGSANADWKIPSSQMKENEVSFYLLPPIKYPDGRYYIKLGLFDAVTATMTSLGDVKQWFDNGDTKYAEKVTKFTESLFKGVQFNSWHSDSCVITETPTERPYIDMLHDQLGVAIGGNGYAAKSSDEIGRLAADMINGQWNSKLPRELFKLRTLSKYDESTFTSLLGKL
ncbi:N-methyl-L-tryptophan oxidase-like isoform X1 [Ruditapes philippinarum]|uniref:N-methyl-L-tryptophan oxidase-like isoform X1 n=1 Tax=Ruditapes philippinarum TaxID=129788 RepID=UPI00295B7058|nr:N-methyl-L-tryptophan oxidase-like isoform X1 [Ruditapes philippinarum]